MISDGPEEDAGYCRSWSAVILFKERPAPAFAFVCSAVLAFAADSGPAVTVVQQYELESCPGDAFPLPQSVNRAPAELSSLRVRRPFCPGYKEYGLHSGEFDRVLPCG